MRKIFTIIILLFFSISAQSQNSSAEKDSLTDKQLAPYVEEAEISSVISNLNFYPNPVAELLNIKFNSNLKNDIELTIFNNLGNIVITDKILPINGYVLRSYDCEHLRPGLYFVQLKSGKTCITKQIKKL